MISRAKRDCVYGLTWNMSSTMKMVVGIATATTDAGRTDDFVR